MSDSREPTYAPKAILVTDTELEWQDYHGNYFNLTLLSGGELEISTYRAGVDADRPRHYASFTIAKPDVPDFLVTLQAWIEQL